MAPVGHSLFHLCHARREHETIRDAEIAAEPPTITGILDRRQQEEMGGVKSKSAVSMQIRMLFSVHSEIHAKCCPCCVGN